MNQSKGMWVMPLAESLSRRNVWEIVSKAALKSRRMRMVRDPESASRRSLVILMRKGFSALTGRKPDWKSSGLDGSEVGWRLFFKDFGDEQ